MKKRERRQKRNKTHLTVEWGNICQMYEIDDRKKRRKICISENVKKNGGQDGQ